DEVSSYPVTTEEGDPVELAIKRADTFGDSKKILAVSTPTVENQCKITRMFEKSDMRYYHVPCLHCSFFQVLNFKNLKWEKGKPETVFYECESCKGKILNEFHKTEMLAKGKWIAKHPERDVIGFHLSSMYSPHGWKSWEQIIQEYEEAKGNPDLERVFVNTVLGEPYRLKGEAIAWEELFARREKYERNIIPKEGLLLTCGVDVQADRLELEIVAWGRNKESWSIDYRVLCGDSAREELWKELTEILNEDFIMEHTGEFRKIQMTCVDSGYNTVH
ncbi:MAG: terminase gpA endonuclease subunit, partial [Bdellovibrionota bacterium]